MITGANFSTGTATCTLNSDNTTNCLVPVTFTPTSTGTLTASLQVTSAGGYSQTFTLSGIAIPGGVATTTTLAAVSPPERHHSLRSDRKHRGHRG